MWKIRRRDLLAAQSGLITEEQELRGRELGKLILL